MDNEVYTFGDFDIPDNYIHITYVVVNILLISFYIASSYLNKETNSE